MDVRTYRCLEENMDFDLFRSEICHMIRYFGDVDFIENILRYNMIGVLWGKKWYAKSFYILAILDYFSDRYEIPYFEAYNEMRRYKMPEPVFPIGIAMLNQLNGQQKEKALEECKQSLIGTYFLKYNIVEKDIEDVI